LSTVVATAYFFFWEVENTQKITFGIFNVSRKRPKVYFKTCPNTKLGGLIKNPTNNLIENPTNDLTNRS